MTDISKISPDGGATVYNLKDIEARKRVPEVLLKDTVGWSGKNKVILTLTNQTRHGVTYTVNDDKTFTTSGTSNADNRIDIGHFILKAGSYHMSGCPLISGNHPRLRLCTTPVDTVVAWDDGEGADFTLSADTELLLQVRYSSGISFDGLTFAPMIRSASIADDTYEPYHPSVDQTLRDAEVIEGKNKLHIPESVVTKTISGVTFTVYRNSEGELEYVNINGTATATAFFDVLPLGMLPQYLYDAGEVLLNGSPAGGVDSFYLAIRATDGNSSTLYNNNYMVQDSGGDLVVDFAKLVKEGTQAYVSREDIKILIRVANGYTANNVKIYPMVRSKSESDRTFEPFYIPLKDSKFDRSEQRMLGAKNLLAFPYEETTKTANGLTFTVNDDGSITINGTATANTSFQLLNKASSKEQVKTLLGKTLVFTSLQNGDANFFANINAWGSSAVTDQGNGVNISIPSNASGVNAYIRVMNGKTLNNVTVHPMLRLASDPDDTYVPYAQTNKELTESKVSYKDNGILGAKNLFKTAYPFNLSTSRIAIISENTRVIRIYSSTAGTWVMGQWYVPTKKNTNYRITCNAVYTSGMGNLSIYNSLNTSEIKSSGTFYADKDIDITFNSGDNNSVIIKLLCTGGTSEVGDVTYNNLMIRVAGDADDTWQPPADTNYELTQNKMSYKDNGILGAKNWLNLSDGNFRSADTDAKYQLINNGIRVYSTNSKTWNWVSFWLKNLPANTNFKFRFNITITLGAARVLVQDKSGSTTTEIAARDFSTNGEHEIEFNTGNYQNLCINFYSSLNAPVAGDVTYSDALMTLATDPDSTYQPYAMTNREITEELTVGEESQISFDTSIIPQASIQYNKLVKIGRLVYCQFKLESVSANSWTIIGTLPNGFRPTFEVFSPIFIGSNNDFVRFQTDGLVGTGNIAVSGNVRFSGVWITS